MFDNFINGIKNGFRVANATRKLVFNDKSLFMYPIIAIIISIIAAIAILGIGIGLFIIGQFGQNGLAIVSFIIILIFLYFVVFFISTYFTIAMLIAFRSYTQGKRISMSEALNRTSPYAKLILEWSIFYTIIATAIRIIEGAIRSIFRYGGNIISGIITGGISLGLAAAVAFALPVIIDEKKGPIDTMKISTGFIMKNFGDTFGGLVFAEIFQIVLTLVGLGIIFLGVLPYITGAGTVGSFTIALSIVLIVLGVITIISGVLLRYVLFNCFKLIVYDYKTRKKLPKGFDAKLIDSSIKRKNRPPNQPSGIVPTGI